MITKDKDGIWVPISSWREGAGGRLVQSWDLLGDAALLPETAQAGRVCASLSFLGFGTDRGKDVFGVKD